MEHLDGDLKIENPGQDTGWMMTWRRMASLTVKMLVFWCAIKTIQWKDTLFEKWHNEANKWIWKNYKMLHIPTYAEYKAFLISQRQTMSRNVPGGWWGLWWKRYDRGQCWNAFWGLVFRNLKLLNCKKLKFHNSLPNFRPGSSFRNRGSLFNFFATNFVDRSNQGLKPPLHFCLPPFQHYQPAPRLMVSVREDFPGKNTLSFEHRPKCPTPPCTQK